jgi:2-polyprenyl-3-methyl-5-hydroxy-6-metoxy-1,4-benzoquinol methylase
VSRVTALAGERRQRLAELGFDYAARPKRDVATCNLCRADRFVHLVHRDRYAYPARASCCARCGLVFLNPVMTADDYAHFYDAVYRPLVSAYHGRRIDAETVQDEQRPYAAHLSASLRPFRGQLAGRKLLDVGGSTGVVAERLVADLGLRATVLDPSPSELAQARRRGLETVAGFVEDFEPGARRFGLITLCQTVDHLLDVAQSLTKIHGWLEEDGFFFVDIVDFRAAYLRHASVEEAVKIDHPYYLTEATMQAYLARAGFEVMQVDYAPDHLHVGFLCRPTAADAHYLPLPQTVAELLKEIRAVQNAIR